MRLPTVLAIVCAGVGIVLAAASGDMSFAAIGGGVGLVIVLFKRLLRTMLWIAVGAYAAFIMPPNGWFFVLLACIVCMSFPKLRAVTPVADFAAKKG